MAGQRHNALTRASNRCCLMETALLLRSDFICGLIPRIEVTFLHFYSLSIQGRFSYCESAHQVCQPRTTAHRLS
jgi:hypothetical protein